MRHLFTIYFLLVQLFVSSFHAEAKENSVVLKEVAAQNTSTLQSSEGSLTKEFLGAGFLKISAGRTTSSYRTLSFEKFGTAPFYAASGPVITRSATSGRRLYCRHSPLALLLLFPKHYFW